MATPDEAGTDAQGKYRMTVSRLTVNNLGIKLYDKVSAVLAELVANSYDADATEVEISIPMGRYLSTKGKDGIEDLGFEIEIKDNGHGMSSEEVNSHYLTVGANRRTDPDRGEKSRLLQRSVMGRKGIGKLAPFGICREIDLRTSGGEKTHQGYLVSHLHLRYDDINSATDQDYLPVIGSDDASYDREPGTRIVLREFNRKRVPDKTALNRQLSSRFGIDREDWQVLVVDTSGREGQDDNSFLLGEIEVPTIDGAKIVVDGRPVVLESAIDQSSADDLEPLPPELLRVTGWVGYAKDPYKDEVMAGVRIYSHGKLFAQTRDFNIPAGFTGEFKLRSYLTGQIHAEWIDDDEDLARSDRQDIIWESEKGQALQSWGQELLKELAKKSENGVKSKIWDEFLDTSDLADRLQRVLEPTVRKGVKDAARLLCRNLDRDAVKDKDQVARVVRLAFIIGPHRALAEALESIADSDTPLDQLFGLFEQANFAERHSLGQVAFDRVEVIDRLESLIHGGAKNESDLQRMLENAPWLIEPTWTPLTANRGLNTFRKTFAEWYKNKNGQDLQTTAIGHGNKRPDFVFIAAGSTLYIVEIKDPGHKLEDEEYDRALRYLEALTIFREENATVAAEFSRVALHFVCDDYSKLKFGNRKAMKDADDVVQYTWDEILHRTRQAHIDYIDAMSPIEDLSWPQD